MKTPFTIAFFLLTTAIAMPQQESQNPVSPYPGGSPFPAGGEPHLTYTATAFWTTQNGMTTEIRIKAKGDRSTQLSCWRIKDGTKEHVTGSIAPDCHYHIVISSEETEVTENVRNIVSQGHGVLEVEVHGFKREDFSKPPVMIVSYLKDENIVGETRVNTEAVPEELK